MRIRLQFVQNFFRLGAGDFEVKAAAFLRIGFIFIPNKFDSQIFYFFALKIYISPILLLARIMITS